MFLVDDDRTVLRAFSRMLEAKGYQVRAFIGRVSSSLTRSVRPRVRNFRCSSRDLEGLECKQRCGDGVERPIIFITGHGEIADSVAAMKAGAIDFLNEPVKIAGAIGGHALASRERDKGCGELRSELAFVNDLVEKSTPREKAVLSHVIAGREETDRRASRDCRKDG